MNKDNNIVRIKKRENPYLVIDKTGIRDERLSWKAKGMLSYLLSLPDDWQIYVSELKKHSSDGRESTSNALKELIKYGYCSREKVRNDKGHFKGYSYTIYEIPLNFQEDSESGNLNNSDSNVKPDKISIKAEKNTPNPSSVENADFIPKTGFPFTGNPNTENPQLLNKDNTDYKYNNQSINQGNDKIDKIDNNSSNNKIEEIKETVRDNICYDGLVDRFDERAEEIFYLIVDILSSNRNTIRVAGEEKQATVVKDIFSKLNFFHCEYVLNSLSENTNKINNIKAYITTSLYNSYFTKDNFYKSEVNHHLYGDRN